MAPGVGAPSVRAATVSGVEFAESVALGDEQLRLSGAGLLRYRIVFRGYAAALYLEEGAGSSEALGEIPRRVEIEYFWSIPADAFAHATREGVARNVDAATFARLREPIEDLNALYRDVAPGDRYALNYRPGVGTELEWNGRGLGVVPGAELSAALFAIWIGDNPLDEGLKRELLGQSN